MTNPTFRPLHRPLAALAALAILCGFTTRALAHQIWLEQDGKAARLCFGEYAENMREESPGRLDKFVSPTATLLAAGGDRPLALKKRGDGFEVSARAGRGESLIVEDTSYPLLVRKPPAAAAGKPAETRTLWTPAARHITDFRAQPARLTLDIVPAGKPGELQVVFRGKPLAAAKVELSAVSGWGRELETDQNGKVSFTLPWKGGYLVKVHHVDATPGKRKNGAAEEAYDTASYSTSLSFVTVTGLTSPPPPPPQKPSPEIARS